MTWFGQVLAEMARHGLKRSENGLEVYVMCEIPSNVILADAFGDIFDGFSISSSGLTQLVLGWTAIRRLWRTFLTSVTRR